MTRLICRLLLTGGLVIPAIAGITIDVYPSSAPNAFGSSSFAVYCSNCLYALENGLSTYGGDPAMTGTAYAQTGPQILGGDIAVTTFKSWQGWVDPTGSVVNELGNRLHFGFHAYGDGSQQFALNDVTCVFESSDTENSLGFSSSYAGKGYSAIRYGIDWGTDRVRGGGDDIVRTSGDGSELVDEIYYVGSGSAWWPGGDDPTPGAPAGGAQAAMDAHLAWVLAAAPITVTCTYTIGAATGSASVQVVAPDEVWVDDDFGPSTPGWHVTQFATIQAGVDAVAAGGTVHVADGTYVENITISRAVHLVGAGAGTVIYPALSEPIGSVSGSFGGSQVIVVNADDVEIASLVVDGDNPGLTSGVVRHGADVDARNGIIETNGPWDGLYVHDCTVKNIYLRGIYPRSGGDGFHIANNTVLNVDGESASIAIMNWGGTGIIEGNTVTLANDAICANWSRGTQYLNNIVSESGSGVHTDNNGGTADLIQGNQVSACSYGIFIFFPYVNAVADNNRVSDADVGLMAWGSAGGTATFTDNTVDCGRSGSVGIYVTPGPDAWGSYQSNARASFTNNEVISASYGLLVETDEDGTFNTQLASTGYVYSDDGYAVATDGLGAITATGLSGDTVAVLNPGRVAYGIGFAAPEASVTISAGTYVEPGQLVIDQDLTLRGAGKERTILKPGFNTTCGGHDPSDAFLYVAPGRTVTLTDFAIDAAGYQVHHAIQSRGLSLTAAGLEISNVRYGDYYGRGIALYTGTSSVQDCVFSAVERIGVFVRGAVMSPAPSATIEGCTYTGKGIGQWLDYGVEAGGGGTAVVRDCFITNNFGVAHDGSTSAGILATTYWGAGTTITVTGCGIHDCTDAIAVGYDSSDATHATIHSCDLSGNGNGINSSSSYDLDATDNYWGSAEGPLDATGTYEVSAGDCGSSVDAMRNALPAVGLGVPVSEGVGYCPWLEAPAAVTLYAAEGCHSATERTLSVDLLLTGATAAVTGGQFYLAYDNSVLTFTGATPGPLFTQIYSDQQPGTIDYAVLVPEGTSGTTADAIMATFTFTIGAGEWCAEPGWVGFRDSGGFIVTRLTTFGMSPIYPEKVDLGEITVDGVAPTVTCPTNVDLGTDDGVCFATVDHTAVDFESVTGYTLAADEGGLSVRTTDMAFSGSYSAALVLPDPEHDFAKIKIPYEGKLGSAAGVFRTYVEPGSAANLMPYMYFGVDCNGDGVFDASLVSDSIVIAFVTGAPSVPQGQWISSGLNRSTRVHVVGSRNGLADGTYSASGTQDTLEHLCGVPLSPGGPTWSDLIVREIRVGAGEWPDADAFAAYVDDVFVTSTGIPEFSDNCGAVLTYTPLPESLPLGDTLITWTVTDCAGNQASCSQRIHVADDEAPEITCNQGAIDVNADAGGCTALVDWNAATADDNCDSAPAITYDIDLGSDHVIDVVGLTDSTYTFPAGEHRAVAKATDDAGNVDTCEFTVTVADHNTVQIAVELEGDLRDPHPGVAGDKLTRCITFSFFDCPSATALAQLDVLVDFEVDAIDALHPAVASSTALVEILDLPCGLYDRITAEDRLHTLTRSVELVDDGVSYTADFVGDDMLLQGDLIDAYDTPVDYVDILDFGVYINRWGWLGNPDTDCSTAFPHADLDGDGGIGSGDFSFITAHFWDLGDAACPSKARSGANGGPRESITIQELAKLGLAELATADLNGDGVIDTADIEAFLSGATPKPHAPVPPVVSNRKIEPAVIEATPGPVELTPARPKR